jgi:DNA uptake protein ComE-like DNA-binding protein
MVSCGSWLIQGVSALNLDKRKRTLWPLPFLLLVLASFTQRGQKDEGWSELLPPGKGRAPVLATCTGCHNLKAVVTARKTRDEWAKSVNDMIGRGAEIFPEELEPITAYLSTAFGPGLPQPVNVNTASREELEKLPNMKPELVSRILEIRDKAGPFKNSEELRRALAIDEAEFEKIRYLLRYRN